jgi:hypothetical protein
MREKQLSGPICGRCTSDGLLMEADLALLELHRQAGGEEGGILALPALRALCESSAALGMKLARTIQVSDERCDHRLLVETAPDQESVTIRITGWQERERDDALLETPRFCLDMSDHQPGMELQLDAALRVLAISGALSNARIGQPDIGQALNQWAQLQTAPPASFPLLEAVAERQAFKAQAAKVNDCAVMLAGQPLLSGKGEFSGYLCQIAEASVTPDQAETPPSPTQLVTPNLKQPLSRIIANAETIHGRLRGPLRENYASYARDIASAARHLRDLVEDFGDLETVEHPGFRLDVERIDCCELARRAAGLLAIRAADHGIAIQTPGEVDSLAATGEYKRVLQILVNLIGNAVNYSPDGTIVTVDAAIIDGNPAIIVQDQGDGIAEEDREHVFEKFERLGRSADGGSGLGLYISRRFARAMGGDLMVDGSDIGARFVLILPPA